MMKKIFVMFLALAALSSSVYALSSRLATEDDIKLLKKDLLEGRLKVGEARLKKIKSVYGDASKITETGSKITYDYGTVKIDFDKIKYLRKWEYDYSAGAAYSDDIDNLRFDLEGQQLVGNFVSYENIFADYGEPTKAFPAEGDGMHSVYYYGEIKLTFENVIALRSWRGAGLDEVTSTGTVVGSSPVTSISPAGERTTAGSGVY